MAAKTSLVATRWGDPFTDEEGRPLRRPQAWIDEVTRILGDEITRTNDRLNQAIQFKAVDYVLLVDDSGVIEDSSLGSKIVTMPDSTLWKNQDKFVENAGANTVSIELNGTQQVSGVDVILISPNTPYPVAEFKSNGPGLTLLSDRNGSDVIGAQYWETKLGDQLTTKFGEKLVFRV